MSTTISVSDTTVTKTDVYSYYGFNAYAHSVVLNTSAVIRVSVAYLKNGTLDNANRNDGTYSYMNKYVLLEGSEYTNWGNDDTYIINYVRDNIEAVINSTYMPEFTLPPHLETI
jgi:hypothetical protein